MVPSHSENYRSNQRRFVTAHAKMTGPHCLSWESAAATCPQEHLVVMDGQALEQLLAPIQGSIYRRGLLY